ncbi:hypothetical protein AN958_00976 [Leucoagaricus sp. SymC.cos]|nr:hypothetical protein AN958_00976 [Leucoagaricus sp. SymC.cos]
MARVIPSSLSPHVCILSSPDLSELLDSSSLPALPEILQSFSPLPQVTTRTTSLTSVPHATFALRFSDLQEIEEACREDEERRAARLIDWMSGRINKRCAKWVSDMEGSEGKEKERDGWRTPWWDEVRRCAEGDLVPSKHEGWNHPVAIVLAASTTAPNPLQAITTLHARALQLPPWVDPNYLKYTLIVHPQNSSLSNEEATALFNAVKKQFGIDVYLLVLTLPSPPPPHVPVPPPLPRLPRPNVPDSPPTMRNGGANGTVGSEPLSPNSLRLIQGDIQQTSKFVREFVVGCLIPWMEKNVLEWSEAEATVLNNPAHNPGSSVTSLPRPSTSSLNGPNAPSPPSQQRRLAEFATILGDYKLAITVWEALRKDSKGGSDILPLVVSTSPALSLHASNSISGVLSGNQEVPPHAQLRALLYAVRWEAGIPPQEFLNNVLEGERWLVWAAGNSEEVHAAILVAHAAYLTSKKRSRRRAAYWYAVAASRLEKCGIKPLTMHFLRKAQELYRDRPPKELSPSFWDAEGTSPSAETPWFDAIMSGIEHPLGRLLYTTGDVLSAVQLFLGLLQGTEPLGVPAINGVPEGEVKQPNSRDKLSLDDFRVAFGHLKDTQPEKAASADLRLPFKFCQVKQSKLRFTGDGLFGDARTWERREENWKTFWKAQGGKEGFANSGDIIVGETFWVDLMVRNPLDAELNLANLTLVVRDAKGSQTDSESDPLVDVDTIEDVTLGPRESRVIPFAITPQYSSTFHISLAKYDFLSILPTNEILSTRGRRLNATLAQRQQPTYAPDVLMKFTVAEATYKLAVSFVEDGRMRMLGGERKIMNLWLVNMGSRPVKEIWVVPDSEDEIWIGDAIDSEEGVGEETGDSGDEDVVSTETIKSSNSLVPPQPLRIPVPGGVLGPEDGFSVPLMLHPEKVGEKEFCLFFVYREEDSDFFHTTRISRIVDVHPLFQVSSIVEPDQSSSSRFFVNVSLRNLSDSEVRITQVSTISSLWSSSLLGSLPVLSSSQSCNILLKAERWTKGQGTRETTDFVSDRISDVLNGRPLGKEDPPPIDLCYISVTESSNSRKSFKDEVISSFVHGARRNYVSRLTANTHTHIPSSTHPYIFPLYNPASFDIILFWEKPRSGHVTIHGLTLGATHAPLQSVIEEVANAKGRRSMYAETVKENMEMLEAIKSCEWNMEMNPLNVSVQGTDGVVHDFTAGPLWTSVDFAIRNYSLTHEAGYTLKLRGSSSGNTRYPLVNPRVLSPPYSSKLNFRGTIPPSSSVTLHPKLWITRAGTYSLDGWRLDTEVYEQPSETSGSKLTPPTSGTSRLIRHRYTQERPVSDRLCLVVQDASKGRSNNADNSVA